VRPVTLITGASSGIGAELARVFAEHGHELVLVARREHRLVELADEIAAAGRPRPNVLSVDLERPGAVSLLAAELGARDLEPANVVNNAGFGLVGEALRLDRNEQLAMIDLNVRALTELSLAFTDSLARHRGGILNVASLAAFLPGPGMAVYYASKAYVRCITNWRGSACGSRRCARDRWRPGSRRAPGCNATICAYSRYPQGGWRASAIAASCAASAWWSPASPTGSWLRCCGSYPMGCCCRGPISAGGACPAGPRPTGLDGSARSFPRGGNRAARIGGAGAGLLLLRREPMTPAPLCALNSPANGIGIARGPLDSCNDATPDPDRSPPGAFHLGSRRLRPQEARIRA
jgi:NADP-dependent 3-hydroxy acid dehydrogenase YdfG